ncbi:MAG: NAD(P)H-dependent oxidoreductase subunit E [Bdellovibrionales bacterium]|nr:NAD(P)H-dependent oxidoreductase subunit E [Bdellovibrionales bacterium]
MTEAPSQVHFNEQARETVDRLIAKYEKPECALLPVLHLAQDQFGYLSPPVINYVAGLLKMPPGKVFDAVSFYTMFRTRDMGKWCLQICHNVTCTMMGAHQLIEAASETLGVGVNGVTEDKEFSLVTVECLGSCDKAPVMQVNNEFVERALDPQKVKSIVQELREKGEKFFEEVTR